MRTETSNVLGWYGGCRDRFHSALGVHKANVANQRKLVQEISELNQKFDTQRVALVMLEAVAQQAQDIIREKIDKVVTTALQTVYQDGNLTFETEIVRVGNRMEVNFLFRYGGEAAAGPVLDSIGGGVLDVASFALRVCLYRLLGATGPIILDEPFRMLNRDAVPRVAEFAQRVSRDMDIQLVVVTHDPVMAESADNVIQFTSRGRVANRA